MLDRMKTICFSLNRDYVNYIRTCIKMLLQHTVSPERIRFVFLLSNDVTDHEIMQLSEQADLAGAPKPRFIYPEKECECGFRLNGGDNLLGVYDQTPFYRILLPDLLSEDKCLYLDADVAVCGNVEDLFEADLADVYIMGVTDRLCLEKSKLDYAERYR